MDIEAITPASAPSPWGALTARTLGLILMHAHIPIPSPPSPALVSPVTQNRKQGELQQRLRA